MSYQVNGKSIGTLLIVLRLMKANQSLDPSMEHRSCEGYITLSPTFCKIGFLPLSVEGKITRYLVDSHAILLQNHRIAAEVLKMGHVPIDF